MAGPISNDPTGVNNPHTLRQSAVAAARREGRAQEGVEPAETGTNSSTADRVSLSAEARALAAGSGAGGAQSLASEVSRQIAGDGAGAMRAQAGGLSAELFNLLRASA